MVSPMTASTKMLPVLKEANYVKSRGDVQLEALWGLCSTNDYITFKKAEELALVGKEDLLSRS